MAQLRPSTSCGGARLARCNAPFTPVAFGSRQRIRHRDERSNLAGAAADYQEQRRARTLLQCASAATTAETAPTPAAAPSLPPISAIDIRIGRILKCDKHPDADSLYVESIDVGEPEPRTIVSGLVQFVPLEEMQDRKVVVLCNLKARNMRGIPSVGMVLCASNATHDQVMPLQAPEDAAVGERVWFGEGNEQQAAAEPPNRVQKKRMWEAVQPHLKTNADGMAEFQGLAMLTAAGPITAGIKSGNIS